MPGMTDIQGLLDQALQDIQKKKVLAIASSFLVRIWIEENPGGMRQAHLAGPHPPPS